MRTKIALITSLTALGALIPAAAWAQEPAAATPPAGPQGATASAPPAATPATVETPASAPAGTPEPAAAAPAPAGPTPAPGWMRIDSDFFGLQLWGGGTLPLVDGVGLAMDIYVNQNTASYGEFDIGPAITAGPLTLTPMIGIQMDWTTRKAAALVPQFYVTGSLGPMYTEFWFQFYDYKMFKDLPTNQINMRLFSDYKISDYVALGPEIDLNWDSAGLPNNKGDIKKVYNLPIGPNLMLSNLGLNSSLIAFVGYETGDPTHEKNHATGRLTFVHNF